MKTSDMKTLNQVIEEAQQNDPEFRKLWDEGEEEIIDLVLGTQHPKWSHA